MSAHENHPTQEKLTRLSSRGVIFTSARVLLASGFLLIFLIGGNKLKIAGNFVTWPYAQDQGQIPGWGPGGEAPVSF